MPKQKPKKHRHIQRVLTPSLLSGISVITIAAATITLLITIFMTNAGTLQQNLINWHPSEPPKTLTLPGQELPQSDTPTLTGSWPLIVLWAFVGLLLYAIASYIVHTFVRAAHFKQTYNTVNSLSHEAMEALVRQLELRLTAFAILVGFSYLVVTELIPYCVLLSRAAASDLLSFHGIVYTVIGFLALATSLHIMIVFSRLSYGRSRISS